MNTLEQIAALPLNSVAPNREHYFEPRTIARDAIKNGCTCHHVKKIANQTYSRMSDYISDRRDRDGLISYARANKGVNDE